MFLLNVSILAITVAAISSLTYNIKHHHISYDYINKNYVTKFVIYNTNYNRTTRTFGVDIETKQAVTSSFKIISQINKMGTNGRFTPIPGMKLIFNICKAMGEFGLEKWIRSSNVTFKCPIEQGSYYMRHILIDMTKLPLPPVAPLGDYQTNIELTDGKTPVIKFSWYGSVEQIKKY